MLGLVIQHVWGGLDRNFLNNYFLKVFLFFFFGFFDLIVEGALIRNSVLQGTENLKMADAEAVSSVEDLYKNFGVLADAKEKAGEVRTAGTRACIFITSDVVHVVSECIRSDHQGFKRRRRRKETRIRLYHPFLSLLSRAFRECDGCYAGFDRGRRPAGSDLHIT